MCSQSLEVGWREALEDYNVLASRKHWKDDHKLSVLSLIGRRSPSVAQDLRNYDVVIITAYDLQTQNPWFPRMQWYTVIADEAHEFLRGQTGNVSTTLSNWYKLQRQTKSMFLLTGTPYTTNIKHDVKRILVAIASDSVRQGWGPAYSDDGIDDLLRPWDDRMHGKSFRNEEARNRAFEQNTVSAGDIAEKMALYTIRRDETSKIRGQPVLRDYVGECKRYEDSLEPADGGRELSERMRVYNENYGKLRLSKGSTETLRCLAYSLRYPEWAESRSKGFWDTYTLKEAQAHVRTRKLIDILKEGKRSGNGVVVFCHRVFLLELSSKVWCPLCFTNWKIMELLGLKYGVVAQKNCKLFDEKLTEDYRNKVIGKAGRGELDAVVVSLGVGKNGCNLQGGNWMVTLNPMAMYSDEVQAMGITHAPIFLTHTRPLLSSWADERNTILCVVGQRGRAG